MSVAAEYDEPERLEDGHPLRKDGSPYPFGGYAYIRAGCRCGGCRSAQLAAAKNRAKSRKTNTARENLAGPQPLHSVVSDLTDAAQGRMQPKAAPGGATAAQITEFGAQLLVYGTIGLVWLATRELHLTDYQTDSLALQDDEARAIAKPLSRLAAKSKFNGRYGRDIVENSDVLDAGAALLVYGKRVTSALADIKRERAPVFADPAHSAAAYDVTEGHPTDDRRDAEPEAPPVWPRAGEGFQPGAGQRT